MKSLIWILLLLIGSNVSAQLPTPTPEPFLILESTNLNDPQLEPPFQMYCFGCNYGLSGGEGMVLSSNQKRSYLKYFGANKILNLEMVDKNQSVKTIYNVYGFGTLWGKGNNPEKGSAFFEEFKLFKKVDKNSYLVKLPIPENEKWKYSQPGQIDLGGIFGDDKSNIYCLTSESGSSIFRDLKEGEMVNAVVMVNGFFEYQDGDKSKDFIKLNVVSPNETNVWYPPPTPNPSDKRYDFLDLCTQGTNLVGKKVVGMVKILQKVNDSEYLISFEPGDGFQRTFYLTNAAKFDAVDNQNVYVGVRVIGTKSYTSVLGDTKTVMTVELRAFSLDGKTVTKIDSPDQAMP